MSVALSMVMVVAACDSLRFECRNDSRYEDGLVRGSKGVSEYKQVCGRTDGGIFQCHPTWPVTLVSQQKIMNLNLPTSKVEGGKRF